MKKLSVLDKPKKYLKNALTRYGNLGRFTQMAIILIILGVLLAVVSRLPVRPLAGVTVNKTYEITPVETEHWNVTQWLCLDHFKFMFYQQYKEHGADYSDYNLTHKFALDTCYLEHNFFNCTRYSKIFCQTDWIVRGNEILFIEITPVD